MTCSNTLLVAVDSAVGPRFINIGKRKEFFYASFVGVIYRLSELAGLQKHFIEFIRTFRRTTQ